MERTASIGLNAPFGARCVMTDRDPFIRQIEALTSQCAVWCSMHYDDGGERL